LGDGFGVGLGAGARGIARGLEGFQLAEAAIDGALDAGFVAGEPGEGVVSIAIVDEGAGQAVAWVGRGGGGRYKIRVQLVVPFVVDQFPFAGVVLGGDPFEALAVDGGFHGEGAVEAPLIGGDALYQFFFAEADGVEVVAEVLEEEQEFFGIFSGEDMFVARQAVLEAVAAGCVLALGAARAGRSLGILTISVDLGFRRFAGAGRVFHFVVCGRGCAGPFASILHGGILGIRG